MIDRNKIDGDIAKMLFIIVVLAIVAVILGGFLFYQIIVQGCSGFPCLNN